MQREEAKSGTGDGSDKLDGPASPEEKLISKNKEMLARKVRELSRNVDTIAEESEFSSEDEETKRALHKHIKQGGSKKKREHTR